MTHAAVDPVLEEEGKSYHIEDGIQWALVTPRRGHVLLVELMSSSLGEVDETWVPLLVIHSSMSPSGGMVVQCKSLGHESDAVSKRMSSMFNRRLGHVHLCVGLPCGEEDQGELHVTQLKWFTLEGAAHLLSNRTLQQARKWLTNPEGLPETAEPPSGTGAVADLKERARGHRADGEDKNRKDRSERELDVERTLKLRSRLEEARARMAGQDTRLPELPGGTPPAESPDGPSDGDQSDSESSSVQEIPILGAGSRLTKKGGVHSKSRRRTLKEDTKELSTSDYAGRLAKQALAVTARTLETEKGSGRKKSRGRSEKKRAKKPQDTLQAAATIHSKKDKRRRKPGGSSSPPGSSSSSSGSKKKGKKRSRSRKKAKKKSKKKKSKKGARKHKKSRKTGTTHSSSRSSSSVSHSSLSSIEIVAPLKKKSRENPGSVLALLLRHIESQMDQGAKFDVGHSKGADPMLGGIRVATYLALYIKPQFGQHVRELRELHLLSSAIDTLRKGHLRRLGDILAGRFVALHQSMLDQSWAGARFLEVEPMNDTVALSEGVMLQARKHAQLVQKSQGVDASWGGYARGKGKGGSKNQSWSSWNTDSQQKGKDKGKKGSKKGKAGTKAEPTAQKVNEWKDSQDK